MMSQHLGITMTSYINRKYSCSFGHKKPTKLSDIELIRCSGPASAERLLYIKAKVITALRTKVYACTVKPATVLQIYNVCLYFLQPS